MKEAIKKNKKFIIIGIVIIILLLIGIAFAYLVTTLQGDKTLSRLVCKFL